jgi:hypothetical protein
LNAHKVEKGSVFTHTALKGGSYYIPSDAEDEFFKLYAEAVENGEDLSITEKHRDISPLLVDLDFRHDTEERIYTDAHIVNFLQLLKKEIMEYVDVSNEQLAFYVMEKPTPRKNKSGGFKDGVHVVCPQIVTKPDIQFIIRQNILKNGFDKVFGSMFTNSYDDIYDEAVISKNNWFLHGSKKPDEEFAWVVNKVYNHDLKEVDCMHTDAELVELLSIRNKYDDLPTKADKIDEIKSYKESKEKPKQDNASTPKKLDYKGITDYETIHKLVMILNPQNADNYHDWLKVGLCLYNICYENGLSINLNKHFLLQFWIEFSQQSSKFKEGECEKLWETFSPRQGGLTEGSLRFWAKKDNPQEYQKLVDNDLNQLIYKSRNETHYDIAQVVYLMKMPNRLIFY